MLPVFDQLHISNADSVIGALRSGAEANRTAACRVGSIDVIGPFEAADIGARLVATGDIHDNPVYLAKVIQAAGLDNPSVERPRSHLTLHELIHSDRVDDGLDFSYRVLARAAALKAAFPELVHVLLANHELAQLLRAEVLKDGVRCVASFCAGLEAAFGHDSRAVEDSIDEFVRSMPLALRVRINGHGPAPTDLLLAHSLPAPELFDRFDLSVLERELTDEDRVPRRGSAHIMVWGRGQPPALIEELSRAWGVGLFVLGHEHAGKGWVRLADKALVINTDHAAGGYLSLDLRSPIDAEEASRTFRAIGL